MTTHSGITERRDSSGRVRYRVRIRRAGMTLTSTHATLAEALSWRSRALDAADGLTAPPARPSRAPAVTEARKAISVLDAGIRLLRGMENGSVRTKRGERYKPSAFRDYESALRLDVLPRVGSCRVDTLSRGDVQRLIDEIAAASTTARARKALVALRVALNLAERYGELDRNPCAGVTVPVSDCDERPARILDPGECNALLMAAEIDDMTHRQSLAAPLVTLALGTGLRLGELLALPWGPEGLDLDAGIVRVRRALDRHRDGTGGYPLVRPKSRASRRDVPLSPDDVRRLRAHREACGDPDDGTLVFAERNGRELAPHGKPRSAWQRIVRASGIVKPLPRFHDLRHAYATHMLAEGLTAHAVAELLGHADAALVWQRYGHALPAEVAEAGVRLASWRARNGWNGGPGTAGMDQD